MRESVRTRDMGWSCRHSSRFMKLLECGYLSCICTWVGSNPCRKLSLLGFDHPVEGSPFEVQGAIGKAALIRGRLRRKPTYGFDFV